MSDEMVAPLDSERSLDVALAAAVAATAHLTGGDVARYIPPLAEVNPEQFAISICSADGVVHEVGDSDELFSLQSASKPFAYGEALAIFGRDSILSKVGVEPTGRSFDSLVRLETGTNRPHNPLINVGAIAISGMLCRAECKSPIGAMLQLLGAMAARPLQVDVTTFLSERDTGHLNRAIGYLLRHFGVIDVSVTAALDLYFQQCAIEVSCRELSVMAATLANGGRNPVTGVQVLSPGVVRDVLAVMSVCGLYDGAGTFFYQVGLPAKSGVSGAIFAVVPGRMGLAAWSPRLDQRGNPLRASAAIHELAKTLDLHTFSPRPAPAPAAAIALPDEQTLRQWASEVAGPHVLEVCLVAANGQRVAVADGAVFPMQATANAFAYALALERSGAACLEELVGVEPSGNPFHEIFLDRSSHRPHNALGNAGAISVCSLVPGKTASDTITEQLRRMAQLAGVPRLEVDAVVLHAEREGGDRNRAIACMLRAHGVLDDADAALDLYLHQCSIRVTTEQLARMAAVLAAGGLDPDNGERLVRKDVVRQVLSVMYTCGLHDESGRFAFDVGVPAKSGISGAIVAVVPGRMGIAVYSPGVNDKATSVVGRAMLVRLAEELRLSVFLAAPGAGPT
tara:strand:- start:7387 stop:9258 length:1872 start_codon:yes stop_codon:yes gene_type:complete